MARLQCGTPPFASSEYTCPASSRHTCTLTPMCAQEVTSVPVSVVPLTPAHVCKMSYELHGDAEKQASTWVKPKTLDFSVRSHHKSSKKHLFPHSRVTFAVHSTAKSGGAWENGLIAQSAQLAPPGQDLRLPMAVIVWNLNPPVGNAPALLTIQCAPDWKWSLLEAHDVTSSWVALCISFQFQHPYTLSTIAKSMICFCPESLLALKSQQAKCRAELRQDCMIHSRVFRAD